MPSYQRTEPSSTEDLEPFLQYHDKSPVNRAADEDSDTLIPSSRRKNWLQWASHALAIAIELGLATWLFFAASGGSSLSSTCSPSLREHELAAAHSAVRYTTRTFVASAFHEHDDDAPSVFEHLVGDATEHAWRNLTTVGVVGLTADQNSQLAFPSVESHPGVYPVGLSMFHQLHCLNYLRISLTMGPGDDPTEDEHMREVHRIHCLDYLRQSVMCNGGKWFIPSLFRRVMPVW